ARRSQFVHRKHVSMKRADRKNFRDAVAIPVEGKGLARLLVPDPFGPPFAIGIRWQRQEEQSLHRGQQVARPPLAAERGKIHPMILVQAGYDLSKPPWLFEIDRKLGQMHAARL